MENRWTLSGKRALITGATKGIGRAISDEFIRLGAEILLVARTGSQLHEQVSQYRQTGAKADSVEADIATEDGLNKVLSVAYEKFDRLDILVNNAGINIRKSTTEYTRNDVRKQFAVNVESAYFLCTGLFDLLRINHTSSIINVSSISSQRVVRLSTAPYAMSKAAMEQMTNYLAVEWANEGIRVNSVHPWFIETPLTEPVLSDSVKRACIQDATPLGRLGEAQEIATVVAFLAMPASSYLTGVNLPIDGGLSAVGIK